MYRKLVVQQEYSHSLLMYSTSWGEHSSDCTAYMIIMLPAYNEFDLGNCFRDIFSLGFGPFRWVCTSGLPNDLEITDNLALQVLESIISKGCG